MPRESVAGAPPGSPVAPEALGAPMAEEQAPPQAPPAGGSSPMMFLIVVLLVVTQGTQLMNSLSGGDKLPDGNRQPTFDKLSSDGKVHISFCTS